MSIITNTTNIEECVEQACIHPAHEVSRGDAEDQAFHETAAIEAGEVAYEGRRAYTVRVTRFDNEDQWYVDAEVRNALSAADALALADAIRLQAGVANSLTEEMSR
jgi:hypothetical protein